MTDKALSDFFVPDEEAQDVISEAIADSMDMDWTAADGARSILRRFKEEGWSIYDPKQT